MKKIKSYTKWILWSLLGVVIGIGLAKSEHIERFLTPKQKRVQDTYVYDKGADSLLLNAMLKAADEMDFRLVRMGRFDEFSRKDKKLLFALYYSRMYLHEENATAIYWEEKRLFGKIELAALMLKDPTIDEIDQPLLGDDSMVLFRMDVSIRREESWYLVNSKLEEFENRVARLAKEDDYYFESWSAIFLQGHR